tara:strand:+ start:615 stop:1892 length:1278 start_codon:yes stop_codon:yes gene_type:complete
LLELWRRIARIGAVKIYSVLLGVVTLAITARILGPEGRGQLVVIMTWVSTFATLVSLSLGQVAIHKAAQCGGAGWLRVALSTLLLYATVVTAFGWSVALCLYWATQGALFGEVSAWLLVLGFIALPLIIFEQYVSSLLMTLEQLDIYNIFQVIGRTVGVAGTLALLLLASWGVASVLLGNLAGLLIILVGSTTYLYRRVDGWIRPSRIDLLCYLQSGIKLHLNAIGTFLIIGADILMLNYFRGPEETAFYQLGAQIIGIMMILPQAASMVVFGKVASLGADRAWSNNRNMLIQVIALMGAAVLFVGGAASWWLVWIAGEEFLPTLDVFYWQLMAIAGMTLSTMMAPQWIGRGYFWQASLVTLTVGILNLTANYLLIPQYGMKGAAWATLGSYMVALITNGLMVVWCERKALVALRKEHASSSAAT